MRLRTFLFSLVMLAGALAVSAQATMSLSAGQSTLLPTTFGPWTVSTTAAAPASTSSMSLVNANKPALAEDQPQRSQVATYTNAAGRALRVEAVQFADYSGAWSAYTLVRTPGLKDATDLGKVDAVGDGAVLFVGGATLVLATPATAADVPALRALAGSLPGVRGSAAQGPALPRFLPASGLVPGSVRYAFGPATYAAQGGVLPTNSIGWDKSAEAVTARYKDHRGEETLTLLLYPTPVIARAHLHAVQVLLPNLGKNAANARARSDLELVMIATGSFTAAEAQRLVDNIHMRQIASVDRYMQPSTGQQVVQAASLLQNIALLAGILCGAAVVLGLFFGGGRALVRVLRGKPAAVEIEFLSLHLANQNAPANSTNWADASGPELSRRTGDDSRKNP